MRPKKMIAISCKNDGNKNKGFNFYKQLIIFKKKFDKDNAINYCIMHNIYID